MEYSTKLLMQSMMNFKKAGWETFCTGLDMDEYNLVTWFANRKGYEVIHVSDGVNKENIVVFFKKRRKKNE